MRKPEKFSEFLTSFASVEFQTDISPYAIEFWMLGTKEYHTTESLDRLSHELRRMFARLGFQFNFYENGLEFVTDSEYSNIANDTLSFLATVRVSLIAIIDPPAFISVKNLIEYISNLNDRLTGQTLYPAILSSLLACYTKKLRKLYL